MMPGTSVCWWVRSYALADPHWAAAWSQFDFKIGALRGPVFMRYEYVRLSEGQV